ncbi:MAG: ATP-binding cassette domain-containing protein, partial [Pseudomonadota bacterium]|nr:ATP-binding cassette domain-containing protein [Pseudomonadota bacterium]
VIDLLAGESPPPGQVGLVFQDGHLIKPLSARANADLTGAQNGCPPGGTFDRWASAFGIAALGDRLVESLSGGEAQRVAVIRALGGADRLLVCDEPTSNLDPDFSARLMAGIREISEREGLAVLWVTHGHDLAARYAHGVVALKDGRVATDDGWPFALPANAPAAASAAIERAKAAAEALAATGRLGPALLDALRLEPVDRAIRSAPEDAAQKAPEQASAAPAIPPRAQPPSKRTTGTTSRRLGFVARAACADLFAPWVRAKAAGGGHARRAAARSVASRTMSWVFVLGLLVFYGVLLAWNAYQQDLLRQLSDPSVGSVQVVATTDAMKALFTRNTLPDLEDAFEKSVGLGLSETPADVAPGAFIFGRREIHLPNVWLPLDGLCPAIGARLPVMLTVFNGREPQFASLEAMSSGKDRFSLGALSIRDMRGGAFLSRSFVDTLSARGHPPPDLLCVAPIDGTLPTPMKVLGVADRLPEYAGRSPDIAIEHSAWTKLAEETPLPDGAEKIPNLDPDGRWVGETFEIAVIYFNASDFGRVNCALKGVCDAGGERLTGLDPRNAALDQLRRLLDALDGSRAILAAVMFAFAASIAISSTLAAQAFVERNERVVAVMRVFGWRFSPVWALLAAQLAMLFVPALALAAALVALFHGAAAPALGASFRVALGFDAAAFAMAATFTLCLALTVSLAVMGLWWRRNRYLGAVLQKL